jgi:hypothetical protein
MCLKEVHDLVLNKVKKLIFQIYAFLNVTTRICILFVNPETRDILVGIAERLWAA